MTTATSKKKPGKNFNGGEWTDARMRSFAMSAIRRAQWPVKFKAINKAFVRYGINPATGRKCKLHLCPTCQDLFPANQMHADHREPVVPIDGKWGDTTSWLGYNWNELLPRLWIELDGFDPLCKGCHKDKSNEERKMRKL